MANRSIKGISLMLLTLGASVFSASCTMGDVRDSMVTGVLGYVKTSTNDVLLNFLPSWKDLAKNAAPG